MSHTSLQQRPENGASKLAAVLLNATPKNRAEVLLSALSVSTSVHPNGKTCEPSLWTAFAEYWEAQMSGLAVDLLKDVLVPPLPIETAMEFGAFAGAGDYLEMESCLVSLVQHLCRRIESQQKPTQLSLFNFAAGDDHDEDDSVPIPVGRTVTSLNDLVAAGMKYPTIYADPPWPYSNKASRGAATNHYPTMPMDDICN